MIYSGWQRRYGRDTCVFLPELVNYSEEEVEGTARMIDEGATTRGDVARPAAVDEGNGKIAAGSKNLRGIAGAEAVSSTPDGNYDHTRREAPKRSILASRYALHQAQSETNLRPVAEGCRQDVGSRAGCLASEACPEAPGLH
jgi:hypothetical protein